MCIIMVKIKGQTLHQHRIPDNSIRTDIKRGIALLHTKNIVFGDLCSPNIMVYQCNGKNRAMFVDFDWCGLHN